MIEAKKRNSTDWNMNRERINGGRFFMGIFGTYLGAAYENMPYICDKEEERSNVILLNQGGTAGIPVPYRD